MKLKKIDPRIHKSETLDSEPTEPTETNRNMKQLNEFLHLEVGGIQRLNSVIVTTLHHVRDTLDMA